LLFFFKSLTALHLHVSESGVFFLAFGHLRMNIINLQDRTVIISEKKLTMTLSSVKLKSGTFFAAFISLHFVVSCIRNATDDSS